MTLKVKPKYKAPLAIASGIFSSRFVGAKSSEAENSTHSSTSLRSWFSAKEYKKFFLLFVLLGTLTVSYTKSAAYVADKARSYREENAGQTLSSKSISLEKRYGNKFVNDVFKDNILLTLNYMDGRVKNKSEIVWEDIQKPREYKFDLKPGESFAFHNQILAAYNKNVVKTTNARFNYQDGFKSDGYLTGDGVCHLASIIYWAAVDASLSAYSPTDHNFANINEVPKEYGVSIFYMPGGFEKSARENLYITNNFDTPVSFSFSYDGSDLRVDVTKAKSSDLGYLN